MDIFYRGAENALCHMFWDGKWSEEEDLGGNLESTPTATAI
jgi:hypothetical protein